MNKKGWLGVDGISLYLIVLTTLLTVIILIYGPYNKEYQFLILISESILLGVFLVLDILYFYILFEMVLIPLYFIMKSSIITYPYRKNKIDRAIYKLLGYTLFGSFFMLLGMILLYQQTKTTNYHILINLIPTLELWDNSFIKIIWLTFFISFAVKVPVMPFHIWLPEAHSEAPTGGSMLLAGILLKLGTYGMIRYLIPLFPITTLYFKPFIEVLFVISILYSSFSIIRQVDIKKFIAYSSMAHMNLCLLGLFSYQLDGLTGGYWIMINHGFVSSALFLLAGILFSRYSLRAIKYYRGLFISMPIFSLFFFIFNLANIGFPPFGPFISEILIFFGLFQSSFFLSFIASFSIILSGVYGIWFITRILYGLPKANHFFSSHIFIFSNDLYYKEFFLLSILFLLSLIFGLFPSFLISPLILSLSSLL
jgi:NADH-ubiquinone oxidoreductase chain 4